MINPIKRYMEYKILMRVLSKHNTMDITKFMKMKPNDKFMVLFSHITATKIMQNIQMKLLWLILTVLCGSTGVVMYSIV